MDFERFCGMASAAGILLILTLNVWLGLWGPVWQAAWEMKPADALGVIVAIVGWSITVLIGAIGFYFAFRQIQLQQKQIRYAEAEIRRSNFLRLDREVRELGQDIDRLKTAAGYLRTFTCTFPPDSQIDGWAIGLFHTRSAADDFISQSAVSAPFGYGERISTVMSRIQRLGDMMTEASAKHSHGLPPAGIQMYYDPRIKAAVKGIRLIEAQIDAEVPIQLQRMLNLSDERDSLSAAFDR
jgi:hypothetical protein